MKAREAKLSDHVRHLCIEGVIGVGKTTLCHLLKNRLDARLVLEDVEENPFLSKFYENRRNLAFQTQLWFLVSRYRQLSEAFVQQDLFSKVAVADYMFAKDRIFAAVNLDENEMALYTTIGRSLERDIPRPDYVVYLQCSTDVLLERIEKRARAFEFNMDRTYIEMLNEAYNHFFFHCREFPLLIINTEEIDFVQHPEDLEEIVHQICLAKPGVNFYRPLGAGARARGQ